ncbi:hypothetical protein SAMN02745671_00100 [Anaerovibrio lipolyticus DSM 3074]|uniref:Tetratricopeptide repeat-containing protein n=2 Tax=Anaerovibrio lipolyticus TaxID=82374 RepID=A0A1M5ZZU8_9FIRM|nr:hypothetical protein SAMN02745671_00100 [Anaerovibrio lipolyticus DSM 3074]
MTAIIMTVAILVVYKVARALDWALSLPALVGCGVCALLINFLSIPVAPFLTEYRFTVLGAMVLVAAIVITSINHFFIRKRRKQLEAADGENSQLKQEAVPAKDELVPVVNSAILSDEEVEALIAKDKEPEPEPIVQAEPKMEEVIPEPEPVIETRQEAEEDISEPEPMIEAVVEEVAPEETEAEAVIEEKAPEETETEAVAEDEAEIELEEASEPEPEEEISEPEPIMEAVAEEIAPEEAEDEAVIEEEAPEAEAEAEMEPEEASEPEPEEEISEPEPVIEAEPEPSVEEKLAGTATLDDVLDYAFELKGSSDWSSALKAYNYALEQYRDDAYAPFLVLEIVNIHKDHGRYDEAIQCFYDALEIPAVADSPDMLAEFEDSMIYLEATKEVLIAENQPDTPFFDIPKDYMSKIESIYNERKARSI